MDSVTQFSIFLVNKPGILAQVTRHLAAARINILAMTMMDSSEHGVLRLVVADADQLRNAIKDLNLPVTETDVIMLELPNKPGALADVCSRLAEDHINISYAYCTTGGPGGKARGVFKVADAKKATKLLNGPVVKHRDMNHKLRRPVALR